MKEVKKTRQSHEVIDLVIGYVDRILHKGPIGGTRMFLNN